MATRTNRRSDRVSCETIIQVSGTDVDGNAFIEEGRTLVLSRHGAAIVLRRGLNPQEVIIIRSSKTREASARVVGQFGRRPDGYIYGVALVGENENLWGIEFPPSSQSDDAVGRLLLECRPCGTRELVYLDEFEVEVFEVSRSISRTCKRCRDTTFWREAATEATGEGRPIQADQFAEVKPLPPNPAPSLPAQEKRRHHRLRAKITALIRHSGHEEEIVTTVNVSRGGLCFRSWRSYLVGSRIDVALPYTGGPANIFVPARIVRTRQVPGNYLLTEFAVEYIQPSSAQNAPQCR